MHKPLVPVGSHSTFTEKKALATPWGEHGSETRSSAPFDLLTDKGGQSNQNPSGRLMDLNPKSSWCSRTPVGGTKFCILTE
ncbi:hypothetical protein LBMAG14_00670 [Actinomycetes bacterium]|nr:hypothetical protein LBMAG14_00670 [Actinomycetes bacterium]